MQGLDEVGARVDGVDVEEDAVLAETRAQMIGQPARIGGSIFSPVADEDSRWHDRRRGDLLNATAREQGEAQTRARRLYAGPPGSSPDGP